MKIPRRQIAFVSIVLTGLATLGCGQRADSGGASEMDALARMLDQPKQEVSPAQTQVATRPAEPTTPPQAAPKTRRANESAAEPGGYLSAIAHAHRSVRTKTDNWAWMQAVTHFKATEGRMPRSHEEFMSGVIKAFDILLPELEQGEEYLYVPDEGQFGELYIVRQQP